MRRKEGAEVNEPVRIALTGTGLAGKHHARAIEAADGVVLCAIADPAESAKVMSDKYGVPYYPVLGDMMANQKPDGIILATPNQVHVSGGLDCVVAGCPMLVEKPLATTAEEAKVLVDAAREAGVPVLVGHHRRYNPLIRKARELIDQGELGTILSVHGTCWLYKPDEYFEIAPWRKAKGAGPVSVNLAHDIDLIRYLCGDVISVQAQANPARRGFENEDTAVALLRFDSGAIGTISVSDTIVAPWSWELTAHENSIYPSTSQSCCFIGGTHGSLSLPDMTLWRSSGERSWWNPISATIMPVDFSEPLIVQIRHFAAVIRGEESPLVSGEEGLKTLKIIEAIQRSAASGEAVRPGA